VNICMFVYCFGISFIYKVMTKPKNPTQMPEYAKDEDVNVLLSEPYLQLRSDSVHYEEVYRAARQRIYELYAEYDTVMEERRRLYAELPDRFIERVSCDRDIAGITVHLASQIFDVRLRRSKCCSDIDEQIVVLRHNRKLMNDADEAADRMLDGYDLWKIVPLI